MTTPPPPLIGLTGRRKLGAQINGLLASFADIPVDIYIAEYARSVIRAGGLPVHLPLDVDPRRAVDRLDAVVLTGGADIDPSRYGQAPHETVDAAEHVRDDFEFAALDRALERDLPVFAICRGLQLVNVHAGGTLHQHVPEHGCWNQAPDARVHEVDFVPGTRLAAIYGASVRTNSLHHQTVDEPGRDVVVAGRAPDGTIEAIELAGRDVLAVQWHPELFAGVDPGIAWVVERAQAR